MKLKQILQKAVIYPVIISQLFLGAYRCGDGSEPNPEQDAQVEVDAGYDAGVKLDSGNLEDVVNTPDADKDVLDSDVPNGDIYQPDTDVKDGGSDASDVDITDTYIQPDGGDLTDIPYVDGGDVDVSDGGFDAGDVGGDVSDGGQGIPPVVIIETKDEQGNVKDTFKGGEWVVWDLNKSYDPDCSDKGTCGSSKGMDYCDWSDDLGDAGKIYFPDFGKGVKKMSYGCDLPSCGTITATAKCYDLDEKLSSTAQATINLID